jgi:hypothetical protein
MSEDSLLWPTEQAVLQERIKHEQAQVRATQGVAFVTSASFATDVESARHRSRAAMTKLFSESAPSSPDQTYSLKMARTAPLSPLPLPSSTVLTPARLSMPRFDIWLDADRQAAMFHAWLLDEDWTWLSTALGLVVNVTGLPTTIASHNGRATIEVHSVRTAMKQGALGWPEQHMVVVLTQWRAGFFDKDKQKAMDVVPDGANHPDFKFRAGCTLLIDPEEMKIRRVIRTPGTVADEGKLDEMREYLLTGLTPPDAFAPVAARLAATAEPFALLHSLGGE